MPRLFLLIAVSFLGLSASSAAGPVLIAEGQGTEVPRQPQLAIDEKGVIHVAFGAGKSIFYCQSADGGKTFSTPVQLRGYEALAIGMRRGPRIVATDKSLCISFIGGPTKGGGNGDLMAFTSEDSGKSWQVPATVNSVARAAREGLHAMASGPKGAICCVWLDLRNEGTQIRSSISSDGGKSWQENRLVYSSPDGSVCECCHPSVAYGRDGQLHVMWRNSLGGNRDMYTASSKDGGKTFSKGSKLGTVTWELDACPMDGGSISVGPRGSISTAWRRDKDIFLTSAAFPRGELIGSGRQPWIATTSKGDYVAWVASKGGDLMLLSPGHHQSTRLSSGADDPVVVTGPQGSPVVVAWESKAHGKGSIQCQVLGHSN